MVLRRLFALVLALPLLGAAAAPPAPDPASRFLKSAAALENPGVRFDRAYTRLAYPMGDVPSGQGVCADVVVRAYRGIGIDLQKLVHEDMARHFSAYPHIWGLKAPDPNIDQRRVLNLRVFFARQGAALKLTRDARDYKPGDLVTWNLDPAGSTPHIGIVMPRRTWDGARPMILHNMGGGQIYQDILFAYKITGHYRYGI
ncbi:MAG TPA: DUF1287 domain-containing protein [Rhizomicrobium sp.]|jgi:hypothetical protein|nr:DUF1287 domain-containing protein [Rhizomicrobium sp.]